METINIHEARTHLSRIVEEVAAGAEKLIAKAGKPMAKLVPLTATRGIRFGLLKGQFTVPDNFDAPLPDEVPAGFAGV